MLAAHAAIADVAVMGVPDPGMGERVLAVVQPLDPSRTGAGLAAELLEQCRTELASYRWQRGVDFVDRLPRDDNGKLCERVLRERYWQGHDSRVN